MGDPRKWINDAGPRQSKVVEKAINNLFAEGRTYTERAGVIGISEFESSILPIFGSCRPEVLELHAKIMESFNGWIRPDNYRFIVTAYENAIEEAKKTRPIVDKRRTPEEDKLLKDEIKEEKTEEPSNGGSASPVQKEIITRNEARGGMEVKFSGKPDPTVIDYLKTNGFHWSRRQSLWYRKYHAALFKEIENKFPPVSD